MIFNFLERLTAPPMIRMTLDRIFDTVEKKRQFRNDINSFIVYQQRETHLDIFKFAERPNVKQDEEYIKLEEIYIPLRLKQLKASLPARKDYARNPKDYADIVNDLIPNANLTYLLDLMARGTFFNSNLLIGSAGSGKSTFMKYMTRLFGSDGERQVRILKGNGMGGVEAQMERVEDNYFPIFLRLRDLETELQKHGQANWEHNFSLETFFELKYAINFETPNFYTSVFRYLPCLFLFDGIDEIPEYKQLPGFEISRDKVTHWIINQLEWIKKINPQARFILTSRPTDTGLLGKHFQVFRIQRFNEPEIEHFTQYWYEQYAVQLQYQRDNEIKEWVKERCRQALSNLDHNQMTFLRCIRSEPLKSLVENPLLLSLTLLIHSVDESLDVEDTEKLYEQFIQTLLYRWDDVRGMNFYPSLSRSKAKQYLYEIIFRLAFHFSNTGATEMPVKKLLPHLVYSIRRFNRETEDAELNSAAQALLQALRDRSSGLLTGKEVSYDFADTIFKFQHKSFQDYLTAVALHRDGMIQNGKFTFADKIGHSFWDKTIEFYVNTGNPDFFFQQYIEALDPKAIPVKQLPFFVQYFLLARNRAAELQEQLTAKLLRLLRAARHPNEIEVLYHCLIKLPLSKTEIETMLPFIQSHKADRISAYSAGKTAWLLAEKGEYVLLRETIFQKLKSYANAGHSLYFWEAFWYAFLPLWKKDWGLFQLLLEHFAQAQPSFKTSLHLALIAAQKIPDLPDLLNLEELRTLQYWRNFQDLLQLQTHTHLHQGKDLRRLGEWPYPDDLEEWETSIFKSWNKFYHQAGEQERLDRVVAENCQRLQTMPRAANESYLPIGKSRPG